jgi:muconolactone D-isomerase
VEFLVRIEVDLPPDLAEDRLARLMTAERTRGRELVEAGHIVRIWRLPGGLRNVGVWRAADATELHELLMSLPTRPWFRTSVEALAVHPLEASDA